MITKDSHILDRLELQATFNELQPIPVDKLINYKPNSHLSWLCANQLKNRLPLDTKTNQTGGTWVKYTATLNLN